MHVYARGPDGDVLVALDASGFEDLEPEMIADFLAGLESHADEAGGYLDTSEVPARLLPT